MKIGRDCSFWELYKSSTIKIPQIQRDYVQGRDNTRVITNRASFAKELISSLKNNKRITLNFIYGYYEDDCFIPIDGQQRLTTLFLLHFLVLSKSGHKDELVYKDRMNFSYQTRYTTNRFFKALYKSDVALLNCNDIKQSIAESSWYAFSWNNDPSIVSALAMLSELKAAFGENVKPDDWNVYYHRLVSENCPVRFMLLEMTKNQLGKPNQLYIRMNSRGKQLTDFENFKASLYGYVYECENNELKQLMGLIKEKVDGDWQTLIWEIADNNTSAEKYSDTFYRGLLHWIFVNRLCTENKLNDDKEWIKPKGKIISDIYLENYVDIGGESFLNCIRDFWYTMITISNVKNNDSSLYERIVNSVLSYGSDQKNNYFYQLAEYKQRIILFSLAKYGRETDGQNFDLQQFKDWYRVIFNLTSNTEIDDPETYCRVCQSIDKFKDVLLISENPAGLVNLSGFASRQIDEEIFKQKIVNLSDEWKNAILEAESDQYFQGEIYFSFLLADIYSSEDATRIGSENYTRLWANIVKVMGLAHDNDVLFHRALLTYGDYSTTAPGGVGDAGVITFFQHSEKHHNYDWRGLLRPENGMLSNSTRMFKEFLVDCIDNDPVNVAYEHIEAYRLPDSATLHDEILYYLIKYDALFKYCQKYYYIWKDDDETDWNRYLLMKTSKRNTYVEAKAYAFYVLTSNNGVSIREGGNPYNPEDRRSYAEYNNTIFEYKKDCFTDDEGHNSLGHIITSPETLKNELGL